MTTQRRSRRPTNKEIALASLLAEVRRLTRIYWDHDDFQELAGRLAAWDAENGIPQKGGGA